MIEEPSRFFAKASLPYPTIAAPRDRTDSALHQFYCPACMLSGCRGWVKGLETTVMAGILKGRVQAINNSMLLHREGSSDGSLFYCLVAYQKFVSREGENKKTPTREESGLI